MATKRPKITLEQIMAAVERDDLTGFCMACRQESQPHEPDARKQKCENCGEHKVYGAEELLLMVQA